MPAPRKTIRAALLLIGGAAALLGAGCGGGDEESSDLASLVPPDAPFYMEAAIRPDGDRAAAIEGLASKIGGIEDPGQLVISYFDAQVATDEGEFTYSEDIEPWLGEKAALFVRSLDPSSFAADMADAAYVVEVTDTDAAQAFIDDLPDTVPDTETEERSYEGVDYLVSGEEETATGIVDDAMVIGTEDSFKGAVDASDGESLADASDFSDNVGGLDDDNLAEVWVDLGTALDAAAESSDVDTAEIDAARAALGPLLEEPLAIELGATEDTVTVDTSAAGGDGIGGDSELLAGLPADAWFAFAVSDAGAALSESLASLGSLGAELGDPTLDPKAITDQIEAQTGLDLEDDVLGWVGDVAGYASGTSESEFSVGTLIEATDPTAATDAIDAGRDALESAAGQPADDPQFEGADAGFSLVGPGGQGIEVALQDGILVGALGIDAAGVLEPDDTLGDSDLYGAASDALGDDYQASAFAAIQDFLVVAEQGDDGDTDYDAARPYTEHLDWVIFGTGSDDDRDLSRVVLGVSD